MKEFDLFDLKNKILCNNHPYGQFPRSGSLHARQSMRNLMCSVFFELLRLWSLKHLFCQVPVVLEGLGSDKRLVGITVETYDKKLHFSVPESGNLLFLLQNEGF